MIIDILLMNNDGVLVKTLWAYHKKNNIPKEYKQRTWTIPNLEIPTYTIFLVYFDSFEVDTQNSKHIPLHNSQVFPGRENQWA